jgi:elongation factor P
MVGATDIKKGDILDLEGAPWLVTDISSHTPSARGAATLIKMRLRNLASGQTQAKTLRGGEGADLADCEKRPIQFLFGQDPDYTFMDLESYDQFELSKEILGDAVGFLVDGLELRSLLYNDKILTVEMPVSVELEVVDTAPALKGATAQAQMKPATLETGIEVLVPPYIKTGERIRVDTRDCHFVERAKG